MNKLFLGLTPLSHPTVEASHSSAVIHGASRLVDHVPHAAEDIKRTIGSAGPSEGPGGGPMAIVRTAVEHVQPAQVISRVETATVTPLLHIPIPWLHGDQPMTGR